MKVTKDIIKYESLKLFAKYGYDGVSIEIIAKKLNIVKSALYKHFKNKEDIFNSIVLDIENDDFNNASSFSLPVDNLTFNNEDEYKNVLLDNLIDFSINQYNYWKNDKKASLFKKLLTIERFKNKNINQLYDNYFINGPLNYVSDIFKMLNIDNYYQKAIGFYSIVYLSYELDEKINLKGILKEVLK